MPTTVRETLREGGDDIAALLADAYSLASDLCTRLHDDALAWVTAERARSAAPASGDVASVAEAARLTSGEVGAPARSRDPLLFS